MTLTIKIDLDSDAFQYARDDELRRLFKAIRDDLGYKDSGSGLYDTNGNKCGEWRIDK